MNTKQEQELTVEIEKSDAGTRIRIVEVPVGADKTQFDRAYRLVDELYRRISDLDAEIDLEEEVYETKVKAACLWIHKDDKVCISESISKNSHRIALSLLRVYPECMQEADVVRETGVPRQTVNGQLCGETKSVANYFTKCDSGYRLTTTGFNWLTDAVLPQYVEHED